MQLSVRHKRLILFSLLALVLGVINYYLFSPGIFLFKALPIPSERYWYIQNTIARHFLKGYLSDICWCTALYLVTVVLNELKYLHLSGKIIILFLPFIVETAQYFHLIPGTFDWFDLLAYAIIFIVFIKLFKTLNLKQ